MTIPDHVERNFKTLGRAAQSGTLGMIACIDPATGAIRFLLCAVAPSSSGIPGIVFAELLDRDPFDTLPPVIDSSRASLQPAAMLGATGSGRFALAALQAR
jgi:hypothetical protein